MFRSSASRLGFPVTSLITTSSTSGCACGTWGCWIGSCCCHGCNAYGAGSDSPTLLRFSLVPFGVGSSLTHFGSTNATFSASSICSLVTLLAYLLIKPSLPLSTVYSSIIGPPVLGWPRVVYTLLFAAGCWYRRVMEVPCGCSGEFCNI